MAGPIDRTNYNALTDDSGGNADGTNWNKNEVKIVLLDPVDALYTALAYSATGTQNNVNFDGGSVTAGGWVRCTSASDVTITGIANGADGRVLGIFNSGAGGNIFLAHNSGSSTAANRLANIATSGNTPIGAGGWAVYRYDATSSLWRLWQHEQGAWITPTFAAGNFTGNNSMTWTVGAGAIGACQYRLQARTLFMYFDIGTTTIGGTPSTQLLISNAAWGSYTATAQGGTAFPFVNGNASSAVGTGYAHVVAAGTSIILSVDRSLATAWSAGANAIVTATMLFPVT